MNCLNVVTELMTVDAVSDVVWPTGSDEELSDFPGLMSRKGTFEITVGVVQVGSFPHWLKEIFVVLTAPILPDKRLELGKYRSDCPHASVSPLVRLWNWATVGNV